MSLGRQPCNWNGHASSSGGVWGPVYNNNTNGTMEYYREHPIWSKNILVSKNP